MVKSSKIRIGITGLGLVSAVGLNMVQSCASVRAGISRFQKCPLYYPEIDEDSEVGGDEEEPVMSASVPLPGEDYDEYDKTKSLLLVCLQDLIKHAGLSRKHFREAQLFMALPPDGTDRGKTILSSSRVLDTLSKANQKNPLDVRTFDSGHVGSLLAIEQAMLKICENPSKRCIVVGIDSYLEKRTLELLDEKSRLKSERNRFGFVPGEAASAVLLESFQEATKRKAPVFAEIEGIGHSSEENSYLSNQPASGQGLSSVILKAWPSADDEDQVNWVCNDLNGENYRAREWGLCIVKLQYRFKDLRFVWHPADCWGDIGAATGTALLALVGRSFERGYAPTNRCLVWTSSDEGERAAVVLKQPMREQV